MVSALVNAILLMSPSHAAGASCPPAGPSLSAAGALGRLTERVGARRPVRIVAIGSSSTAGAGASSAARTYPALLESRLRDLWQLDGLRVENAGVGGETAVQTVTRLETALGSQPDLVIWQVGTNDAVQGGNEDEFRALLLRGVAAARQAGVDMILLDQQLYPGIPDLERYRRYVAMVREVGRERGVPVFSRFALMSAWAGQSADELRSMLAADAFHMSDRGYACLTRSLAEALTSLVPAGAPPR